MPMPIARFPLALAIGGLMLPGSALAQKGAAPAPPPSAPEPDDIVVSGKALPGAVIGDIPPENRLTPADIAAYGVGTVNELLDQIADQTQSDQGRGSSGPVILVNGRRISGINEIGDLPTEAIARVDILPEEVALKYGYSATQKVVNIILRRRFRARVANLGAGAATDGGGGNGTGDIGYTRIHDNQRLNIVARAKASAALLESARGIIPDPESTDPVAQLASDPAWRTLSPSTRNYTLNGTYAYQISPKITASFNANGGYQTSRGLVGAAPLSGVANDPDALRGLRQDSDSYSAHGGVTLNADITASWRLSFTGTYDHSDVRADTDRFQNDMLRGQHSTSITNSAGASLLATGPLFSLPAGKVRTSFSVSGNASRLSTANTLPIGGPGGAGGATRSTGTVQMSLDVPLTSRKTGFLGAIGTLTANVNGALNQVSGYGTLGNLGYGLNWSPRTGISIIASVNEDRLAPTLQQLQAPLLIVPNVRIYDFTTGETVQVSQITGGNPALKADDRHVFKLGFSLKPVSRIDLTLNANFMSSRIVNPIGSLSGASPAAQSAFPTRFIRDDDGDLVSIDARPLNFAREDREQVRWGIVFSQVLRAATRPPAPPGGFPAWRERHRADGQPGGPPPEGGPPEGGAPPQTASNDVIVSGRRDGDNPGPPPPPPDGNGPDRKSVV